MFASTVRLPIIINETCAPQLTSQTSIEQLKESVQRETGVEAAAQRLVFAGRSLDDERPVTPLNP